MRFVDLIRLDNQIARTKQHRAHTEAGDQACFTTFARKTGDAAENSQTTNAHVHVRGSRNLGHGAVDVTGIDQEVYG
jgi:hypothetical protein